MVIIRLARHGAKKRPFYKVVAIDSRKARNSMPLEYLGYFNPFLVAGQEQMKLDIMRIKERLITGAKMTLKVAKLYRDSIRHETAKNSIS